jgi:EAL domain-containing protein (putative c-di-GMP-specific phosphodiesterase class I)
MTMDQVEQVIDKMHALKDRGIGFSIDDFGTGYSSLAYLKRLPVDSLKIDRSFVKDILVDANDAIIVQTIIAMAENLGIESVAQGVESDEVLAFLKEKGCRYFQGWLFGRPEPLEHLLPKLLGKGQGRAAVSTPAWFTVRPCEI